MVSGRGERQAELDRENAHFLLAETVISTFEEVSCARSLDLEDPEAVEDEDDEEIRRLQHLTGQVYPVADPVTVPELLGQPLLSRQTAITLITWCRHLTSVCSIHTHCSKAPPGDTAPSPPPGLCRGRPCSCSPLCLHPAADCGDPE